MRARTVLFLVLSTAISVAASGCGRYSYRIRRDVDAGHYQLATARCQSDEWAAGERWNDQHEARFHVYCGLAYLNVGDTQRAQSELVRAEKMRLDHPWLIRGRDLAALSDGLVRLFGVPAGQLEIEVRPGGEVASAEPGATVIGPPTTFVPPAPPAAPNAPSVGFSAGATVHIGTRAAPPPVVVVPPAPDADEDEDSDDADEDDDEMEPPPPAAPPAPPAPPAQPPVIVIPDEDGVDIN